MSCRAILLSTVAVLGWGCATASRGTTEMLQIATVPPGASVSLSTGAQCTSPCEIEVKRRGPLSVTATLRGCEAATVEVESKVDRAGGWTLAGYATLFLGGLSYESAKATFTQTLAEGLAVGTAIRSGLASTPLVILGAEPEDCPKSRGREGQERESGSVETTGCRWQAFRHWIDMATGALNSLARPNPVLLELDVRGQARPTSPDRGRTA